jgi:hypothetical protein
LAADLDDPAFVRPPDFRGKWDPGDDVRPSAAWAVDGLRFFHRGVLKRVADFLAALPRFIEDLSPPSCAAA